MKYILTILYLIFTTSGLTLMKMGGDSISLNFSKNINFKIGWLTLLGLVCYLISFFLWQKLLIKYDLSTIVPLVTGITQIIILIIGYVVFKESLNITSLIGSIIIIIGIVIMNIK